MAVYELFRFFGILIVSGGNLIYGDLFKTAGVWGVWQEMYQNISEKD